MRLAMNKRGNHKQSLPERAEPETWPNIIDPQSWPNIIDFQSWPNIEGDWPSQWLVNADPKLEADRLSWHLTAAQQRKTN